MNHLIGYNLPIISIPELEIYRRFSQAFLRGKSDLLIAREFGEFVRKKVKKCEGKGVLIGWSSATLEALLLLAPVQ